MPRSLPSSLLMCVLLGVAPAAAQTPNADVPVIVTQGEGVVKRAPDQAWVTITAEARAAKPADAQKQSATAMTAVQNSLKSAGLASDAIKTIDYSLRPDYDYSGGTQRVRGYIATNRIEVRVDDLDKVGAVIDAASTTGATSISRLRFDLKDRATAEREALKLAVQDAVGRAQAMASGAGRSAGAIVRVEEQRIFPMPKQDFMAMASQRSSAVETPITAGETEVRAQVVLTVAIR